MSAEQGGMRSGMQASGAAIFGEACVLIAGADLQQMVKSQDRLLKQHRVQARTRRERLLVPWKCPWLHPRALASSPSMPLR